MRAAELAGVSKAFGALLALDALDFEVESGEIVALLGPNGAGKTTALHVLLGLRRPDRGTARIFGRDPRRPETRRCVGCTPQETSFPPTLRVREVVDLVRAHYRSPLPYDTVEERFDLGDLRQRQVGGLSGGQRRRLACALAYAGDPKLVVLDEPSTGLDIEARLRLWEAIRDRGRTTLLTTHYLEEAAALATRIVVIRSGRIIGTIEPQAAELESAYLDLVGAK